MFLQSSSSELNTHHIHPDWHCLSDHAPLMVTIPIVEEYVEKSKWTIAKNSKKEANFVNKITTSFSYMDTLTISNIDELEEIVLKFANIVDQA